MQPKDFLRGNSYTYSDSSIYVCSIVHNEIYLIGPKHSVFVYSIYLKAFTEITITSNLTLLKPDDFKPFP